MSVKDTMVAAARNVSTQLDHTTALVMLATNCTPGTAARVGCAHHSFWCTLSWMSTNLHYTINSMEYSHSQKLISHSTDQEIFHMQYSHLSLSLPRNLTTKFCMQLSPRTNLQVQDITISESKFHYYILHILCPFSDKVMIYHDSWTGTGPSVSTSMSAWTRRMVGATWTASIQRAATFVPAVTTMCWTQTSIPA